MVAGKRSDSVARVADPVGAEKVTTSRAVTRPSIGVVNRHPNGSRELARMAMEKY
jgi:hypothetical protein